MLEWAASNFLATYVAIVSSIANYWFPYFLLQSLNYVFIISSISKVVPCEKIKLWQIQGQILRQCKLECQDFI